MKEKSANQQIATVIRVALAEKNLKRKILASMTGYPIQRINTMCAGRHDFNIEEIAKLESALGIKLLLIPSVQRVITITMDIDKDARLAKIGMKTTENGLPKEKWTANELLATANALILKAHAMLGSGFPYPEGDVNPDDGCRPASENAILEYSEQQHCFHLNRLGPDGRLDYEPFSNDFRPVTIVDIGRYHADEYIGSLIRDIEKNESPYEEAAKRVLAYMSNH